MAETLNQVRQQDEVSPAWFTRDVADEYLATEQEHG
jgi:hypothetical protein